MLGLLLAGTGALMGIGILFSVLNRGTSMSGIAVSSASHSGTSMPFSSDVWSDEWMEQQVISDTFMEEQIIEDFSMVSDDCQ